MGQFVDQAAVMFIVIAALVSFAGNRIAALWKPDTDEETESIDNIFKVTWLSDYSASGSCHNTVIVVRHTSQLR